MLDQRASPVAGTIPTNASSVPMRLFQGLRSRAHRLTRGRSNRTALRNTVCFSFQGVRPGCYPSPLSTGPGECPPRGEQSHRHRSEVIVKMNRTHGHPWFAPATARAALLALVCIAAGAVAFAVEQTGELK